MTDIDKLTAGIQELSVQTRKVGIVYDERMCAHEEPTGFHVETPERITSIFEKLTKDGLVEKCIRVPAREVTLEELTRVHGEEHCKLMLDLDNRDLDELIRLSRNYGSIYFCQGSSIAASLSAGSVVELTEMVVKGELESAVAVVRPPGHHAEANEAMGFCLFHNVGVAAAHARDRLGVKKILIVDWDVHHGNATQNMFWEDDSILFFSLHRWENGDFYPPGPDAGPMKVGGGKGIGKNVNVAWNTTGVRDESYLAAFDEILIPMCKEFQPELILVSAGFDSAKGDYLGGLCVTPEGYSEMTKRLLEICPKIVIALEGGYNLNSISISMSAVVSTILGFPPLKATLQSIPSSCRKSIDETISNHAPYWSCLKKTTKEQEKDSEKDSEKESKETSTSS